MLRRRWRRKGNWRMWRVQVEEEAQVVVVPKPVESSGAVLVRRRRCYKGALLRRVGVGRTAATLGIARRFLVLACNAGCTGTSLTCDVCVKRHKYEYIQVQNIAVSSNSSLL